MSKPKVTATRHTLPFDKLSPQDFERLCLWLVRRDGWRRPEHLGEAGSEQGRDVIAWKAAGQGEQLWFFQCKRYKTIGASTLRKEVEKYNALPQPERPHGIVFVTNAVLSKKSRDAVTAFCLKQGYVCEFWAHTELDERVKAYPEIVREFFDLNSSQAYNALHQLPAPPPDFTGRERELNELLVRLGQGVTISKMHGLGGVGKTALALKLAERIQDSFPDAQIYLDLQGAGANPLSPTRAMEHVIRAYHPTAKLPESLAELSAIYRSTLHGQRALLLMDNARNRSQVEPLILPAPCVLLVTSRQHFTLPGMFDQNLDVLPRADAIKLLLAIAERIGERADEIARLCGDLPLALRVAASALAERSNLTPAELVRRLGDERFKHLKEVETVLTVSYELLEKEQRRLWRALAVFPQSFDDKATTAVWQMEDDAAQDALGDLMKCSLIEFSAETGRYRLHDLARLFAEARLSEAGVEEMDAAQRRFALHYQVILATCQSLYDKGNESVLSGLALFDQERSNILAGQGWAEATIEKDQNIAQLCMDYPNSGVDILDLRLTPRERIHWLEVQLAISRQLKRRDSEGAASGNLGIAWAVLGETRKAIEFFEQHLAIARETGDCRGEGNALGNLGSAWVALGETRNAIGFYEQLLTIAREIGDRRSEGGALSSLGTAYRRTGEMIKSIESYEQALIIAREIGDRRGEGYALWGYGYAYAAIDKRLKAIECYKQALTIIREIGDRRGEGSVLGELGEVCADLGDIQKAIMFCEQSLAIRREIGDRRGEGNALANLSLSVARLGDRAQAITLAEAALKIYEAIESPHVDKVRKQLAEWRGQAETE